MDTQKICSVCNQKKDKEDFYVSQRGKKCKKCILLRTREYKRKKREDSNFRKSESLKQKERRYRLWINTLINDSKRTKNIENTITIEDVRQIYEDQNGLCFWFKIPLIPSKNKKHPQQPSIDRLNRDKGYTKDNIVLSCYSANIGRNENDVEVWVEFLKLLKL